LIRLAEEKDVSAAVLLSDAYFGKGYISRNFFKSCLSDPHRIFLVAEFESKVVGFGLSMILNTNEDLEASIYLDPRWLRQRLSSYLPVGLRKGTVVDELYRGRGFGAALIEQSNSILEKRGCKSLVTPVWKSTDYDKMASSLTAEGHFPIGEFREYWKEDSIKRGFQCEKCGHPCQCSMILYFKAL